MRTSLGKAHPPGKPSALPETSGEYEVWAGPYWCWWEEHCIPSALEPLTMPRGRQNHRSSWGHKWREANCGSCPTWTGQMKAVMQWGLGESSGSQTQRLWIWLSTTQSPFLPGHLVAGHWPSMSYHVICLMNQQDYATSLKKTNMAFSIWAI